MKVVLIGASPYDALPSVLDDILLESRHVTELCLVELNPEMLQLQLTLAQALAKAADNPVEITGTRNIPAALPGAALVCVMSAYPDPARWQRDAEALTAVGLGAQARVYGGLGGLLGALRAVRMVRVLSEGMAEACPQATLLLRTPPLDITTQAACNFARVHAFGLGAEPVIRAERDLCALLGLPRDELRLDMAGLPAAPWLLAARHTLTGEDLLPQIHGKIAGGAWGPLHAHLLDCYGAVAVGDVRRHADLLPDMPDTPRHLTPPTPGTAIFQRDRLTALATVATDGLGQRGRAAWASVLQNSSGAHPGLAALSLAGVCEGRLRGLALLNQPWLLPTLPEGIAVQREVRCLNGTLQEPDPVYLPAPLRDFMAQHGAACQLAARAAWFGDRSALREAVETLPALSGIDRLYTLDVLEQCLARERDSLPHFFE